MSRISYEQAFEDHKYLWETYGPAYDMTGGYTDSEDLGRLLRSPTKSTARDCLCSQIVYWFSVGPGAEGLTKTQPLIDSDPMVAEIAERHGI